MRSLRNLIILIAFLWVIDALALDGYYTRTAWQQAQQQGQKVRNEVQGWLNKFRLEGINFVDAAMSATRPFQPQHLP